MTTVASEQLVTRTGDFRLRLSVVTQRTLARALGLLGVAAPESM